VINVAEKPLVKRLSFSEVLELKTGSTYRIYDPWSGQVEGCFTVANDLKIRIHDTSVLILKKGCTERTGIVRRSISV
jgi:hypothetical protein